MKIKAHKKKRIQIGICDGGPYACVFEQTIEGERACGKPPIFEKCQYQVTPEEIEWIE